MSNDTKHWWFHSCGEMDGWMDVCMSESDQLCNVISRILHVKVVFYANARS